MGVHHMMLGGHVEIVKVQENKHTNNKTNFNLQKFLFMISPINIQN
jgi:hypothetical protein